MVSKWVCRVSQTRRSTWIEQTSLAEADHYPHISFDQSHLRQTVNMHSPNSDIWGEWNLLSAC